MSCYCLRFQPTKYWRKDSYKFFNATYVSQNSLFAYFPRWNILYLLIKSKYIGTQTFYDKLSSPIRNQFAIQQHTCNPIRLEIYGNFFTLHLNTTQILKHVLSENPIFFLPSVFHFLNPFDKDNKKICSSILK